MRIKSLATGIAAICLLGTMAACSGVAGQNATGTTNAPRPSDASITASSTVNAFSLHVGDCLNSASINGDFSEVPGVPCNEAHDSEVTYIYDLTDASFDADTINAEATTQCTQALSDYVGPNYASVTPGIGMSYFIPTSDSWNSGDREVDCLAMTTSNNPDLTSSVKGTGN